MIKKCKKCREEMYQDDQGKWFCPDCILEEIDPAFLDEVRDDRGELTRPYVLEPPTETETELFRRLKEEDPEFRRVAEKHRRLAEKHWDYQVSIRLPVTDLELAKRLAKRKGIAKYQSYIKTLLHEALVKEASQG